MLDITSLTLLVQLFSLLPFFLPPFLSSFPSYAFGWNWIIIIIIIYEGDVTFLLTVIIIIIIVLVVRLGWKV